MWTLSRYLVEHTNISNERKERLKPILNENIRGLCDKDTTLEYLFGGNLVKSVREAKENHSIGFLTQ